MIKKVGSDNVKLKVVKYLLEGYHVSCSKEIREVVREYYIKKDRVKGIWDNRPFKEFKEDENIVSLKLALEGKIQQLCLLGMNDISTLDKDTISTADSQDKVRGVLQSYNRKLGKEPLDNILEEIEDNKRWGEDLQRRGEKIKKEYEIRAEKERNESTHRLNSLFERYKEVNKEQEQRNWFLKKCCMFIIGVPGGLYLFGKLYSYISDNQSLHTPEPIIPSAPILGLNNLRDWLKLVGLVIIGILSFTLLCYMFYLIGKYLWNSLSKDEDRK